MSLCVVNGIGREQIKRGKTVCVSGTMAVLPRLCGPVNHYFQMKKPGLRLYANVEWAITDSHSQLKR